MRLGGKRGIPQNHPPPSTSFRREEGTEWVPNGESARNLVRSDEKIPLEKQKNAKYPARDGKTCSARPSRGTKEHELGPELLEAEQRLKQPNANLFSFVPMIKLDLFSIDCLSWF